MVYKIMNSKYRVFVETLVFSLLILLIGMIIGFYIESARISKVADDYKNFEIEALDLKLQNYYFQIMDQTSCKEAIKQNFIFADDLYEQGLVLERYEESNQITDEILREKRRYVLLKTELWLNSILLKEKCGEETFHTIVYFYTDNKKSKVKETEQAALAGILRDIKQERGNDVILLPIAGDLGLEAINLQRRIYNVTYLPSLVIDERYVIEGFHEKEEVDNYLE